MSVKTYAMAIRDVIAEEMRRDDKVFIMGEDIEKPVSYTHLDVYKRQELDKALAELMGKATGYCKGRGGSMHIADLTKGNLGANAIVGGGPPIATGAALALSLIHI